jgi:phosphopantothenate---cysteine ligase (CTP)
MRCYITAGPTWEPLDQARRLTNFSTGSLGGELANALAAAGHYVTLFLSETAVWRSPIAAVSVRSFSTTQSLWDAIQNQAESDPVAFFHAAAVSDFAAGAKFRGSAEGPRQPERSGKPSTQGGSLWVELVPTPKILPQLRTWFPAGFLTGWKYEVEGGPQSALGRGEEQLARSQTDACVVNGPAWGDGFCWLHRSGRRVTWETRSELILHLRDSLSGIGS